MCNLEYMPIKDIKVGMKEINVVGIILEISPPTITKEAREVQSICIADESAVINLSVWDAPGALLVPGDIIRVTKGYASIFRAALTLYCSKKDDLQKIGEFCMLFNEQVNMSEVNPALMYPPIEPESINGAQNNTNNGQPSYPGAEFYSRESFGTNTAGRPDSISSVYPPVEPERNNGAQNNTNNGQPSYPGAEFYSREFFGTNTAGRPDSISSVS